MGQHEPPRRDPHRDHRSADPRRCVVWNCNPLVIVPERRADPRRHAPRRPVHRRPRAVPHRHRPLRRHRAAGDHADREPPTSCRRGATCGWAGTRPPSSRAARRSATASCFRRLAGAMGYTEPALFDDDMTVIRDSLPGSRPRRAAPRSVASGCRIPTTAGRSATACSPPPAGKVEFVSEALVAMGQPALPTFVPPVEGPGVGAGRALPAAADDPQAPHPVPQRQLLAPAQARRPRGRPVRRARAPPTPPAAASPTGSACGCSTTAPSIEVPARISERLRPGVVSIPLGWWSRHHPDGKVANSLTNDTLTEWGGGVAFCDTLVEVSTR